jgi:hypothetical protein
MKIMVLLMVVMVNREKIVQIVYSWTSFVCSGISRA